MSFNPLTLPSTSAPQVSPFRTDADEDHVGGPLGIELEQLCISVAGRELLEDSKLSLQPGSRYGLVGANGVGKSTLLRQLAVPGRLVPAHISSLIVEQEDAGDERDAVQTVVDADTELLELLERERMLQEADDSGDTTRAASAVAQVRGSMGDWGR